MSKHLPFTRYIWCECGWFKPFDLAAEHDAAMSSRCPKCGSRDIASLPPKHHERRLARAKFAKAEGRS